MTEIRAFNKYSLEIFKLYFEDGKLVRNYSYNYVTLKAIFDEYRNPTKGQVGICVEHFNRAISNICIQERDVDFEDLLFCLRNDKEYLDIAKKIISTELKKMSKRINAISKVMPNVLKENCGRPLYDSSKYLTPQQICNMNDEEMILVNRIAINSQLAIVGIRASHGERSAALKILLKASREMESKEYKSRKICWGVKMTVKDIKIAFGRRLKEMPRSYFRKITY